MVLGFLTLKSKPIVNITLFKTLKTREIGVRVSIEYWDISV